MFSVNSLLDNSVRLKSWDSLVKLPIKRLYQIFPVVKTKTHLTKPQILVKILQLILVRLADSMSFTTAMEALNLERVKTPDQLNSKNSWKVGQDLRKRDLMIQRVNILRNLIIRRQQAPSIPIPQPSNNSQGKLSLYFKFQSLSNPSYLIITRSIHYTIHIQVVWNIATQFSKYCCRVPMHIREIFLVHSYWCYSFFLKPGFTHIKYRGVSRQYRGEGC